MLYKGVADSEFIFFKYLKYLVKSTGKTKIIYYIYQEQINKKNLNDQSSGPWPEYSLQHTILLTHYSLDNPKRVIGKQYISRSDASE